jgi:hypothetical protein
LIRPRRALFPRRMARGAPQGTPLMSTLYRVVLMGRLPILLSSRLLWSQVWEASQEDLELVLVVPLEDEEFLMEWADDLLLLVMLASLD